MRWLITIKGPLDNDSDHLELMLHVEAVDQDSAIEKAQNELKALEVLNKLQSGVINIELMVEYVCGCGSGEWIRESANHPLNKCTECEDGVRIRESLTEEDVETILAQAEEVFAGNDNLYVDFYTNPTVQRFLYKTYRETRSDI